MIELNAAHDRPILLASTRSHADDDAHRDFDQFDVNEELARVRRALHEEATPAVTNFIATAFSNIDEWIVRGGPLPKAWKEKRTS
jgi:hypothetical protein